DKEIAIKEGLCSLASIPLNIKGKVIGVLSCYTFKSYKFTKTELDVLTTLANQTAIAIENVELKSKVAVLEEELVSRKIIERAKDILAQELNISSSQAYRMIQKQSMDSRQPMRQIAEAIITTHTIKNKKESIEKF
ncbi:MAG: GAF and ANTAR domain-containing protein, partial [Candidatus Omnitrophica bacterium]|nr:GAF and ANTAR domain-containing protein [Candidatus Omnitrophota bacterium]